MEERDSAIDKAIREAMDEGKFENLPGKGQPFKPENPYKDPDKWAAQRILDNAGFTPDWLADKQEIEAMTEQARKALHRTWLWRSMALDQGETALAEDEWRRAVSRFRDAVKEINKRTTTYNLKIPPSLPQLHLSILNADAEIARFKAG